MPVVDDRSRLGHIIEASEKALRIVEGRKRADLDRDDLLGLALVRLLEIVGEAAWGISEGLRSRHPEIPWRSMIGIRNRLIHGYFEVDLDIVWKTVTAQLPPLVAQLQKVLDTETNADALNKAANLSLRGAKRRSNPGVRFDCRAEIASPPPSADGLAMTHCLLRLY